ncbi:MAG: AAA family ATPase [Candidatus Omnitrophota bacterium]
MLDEKGIKQIPYGIAHYNLFGEEHYYFVDKTSYIRNIESKGRYLFFIRPRRFGKTLFLSVLGDYYDIVQKDQFDALFEGTDIHKNPTTEKNKYLVFKLNFSLIEPELSTVQGSFLDYIKGSVFDFIVKYQKFLDIDVNEAKSEINSKKSASEVMVKFLSFCERTKQKIYVIIDEYDNFANTILSTEGEAEFQRITHGGGFLRAFFNVLKGGTTEGSAPISRLFMTGVSPITLSDVTSGFNIATNISLDSDVNEILGFTKSDVETMIDYYRQTGKIHHSTPELLEIMGKWYNHYRFSLRSNREVFNTVHVLYFLREYMKDSQIPSILIDENIRIDYQKLRHLIIIDRKGTFTTNGNFSRLREIIENGSVHSRIGRSFPIQELTDTENFTSLLYYFGLLTIDGIDEENKAILKIPNESIKHLYYDYITKTFGETGLITLNLNKYEALMKEMAFNGRWKPLLEYLAEQMGTSMGVRDLMKGEKSIQAFLNVYLGLSGLYLVSSEMELKKGYADLVLEPFLAQYPGLKYAYLFEIKYIKPLAKKKEIPKEKLDKLKEDARAQLDQYGSDERFLKVIGKTALKKIILIFCGHRLVYHGEASPAGGQTFEKV